MGSIGEMPSFDALWNGKQARRVRGVVRTSPKNRWMVGAAVPVMRKYVRHPAAWVLRNKLRSLLGKPICINSIRRFDVGQDPRQGNLRVCNGSASVGVEPRRAALRLGEDELAEMLRAD